VCASRAGLNRFDVAPALRVLTEREHPEWRLRRFRSPERPKWSAPQKPAPSVQEVTFRGQVRWARAKWRGRVALVN
jgi:hypothetical protein